MRAAARRKRRKRTPLLTDGYAYRIALGEISDVGVALAERTRRKYRYTNTILTSKWRIIATGLRSLGEGFNEA